MMLKTRSLDLSSNFEAEVVGYSGSLDEKVSDYGNP